MSDKTIRCTTCASEFTNEETQGASCCPKCGAKGVPCLIAEDVTLKINWHELRLLTIWADNWARNFDESMADSRKALAAIISRLEHQYPDKTPLTLAGEIKALQNEFPEVELHRGNEIVVPKKRVQ